MNASVLRRPRAGTGDPLSGPRLVQGAPQRALTEDLRCDCGNLLARLLAGEIELKCRRCKRVVTLSVEPGVAGGAPDLRALRCVCEDAQ
ncbi:MAG: hypothetical protein IT371_14915 [Deltaproteobacteria bacterium]|nr:hypothetical protein [Deltaproteobacteria bacterium]